MAYEGLQTETVTFRGHNGDRTEAYYARPAGPGKVGGVLVLHHILGWDEWTTEVVRKFAHNGYAAIAPNLFFRFGQGSSDDVASRAAWSCDHWIEFVRSGDNVSRAVKRKIVRSELMYIVAFGHVEEQERFALKH